MSIPIKGEEVKLTAAEPTAQAALGAAQNIAEGKLPTSSQIEEVLSTTKQVISEQPDTTITKHAKALISDAEKLLREKNRDGQLEKFLNHAIRLAKEIPEDIQKVETDLSTAPLKVRAQMCAESLKNLVYSLIKSGEFRAVLLEFIDLGYIIFVKASGEAQTLAEQKVKSVEPFVTTYTTPVPQTLGSTTETYGTFGSEVSRPVPSAGAAPSGQPLTPTATTTTTTATPEGPSHTLYEAIKTDVTKEDTSLSATKEVVQQTKEAVGHVVSKLSEGEYIPEAERKELREKFDRLMDKLVYNAELKKATHNILSMIDYIHSLMTEITRETEQKVVDYEELKQLWYEGKAVIENFAGNRSLDSLENTLWELFNILRDDHETNKFFRDLRDYIITSLDHPDKLKDETWRSRAEEIFNRGRGLMQSEKYQLRVRIALEEMQITVNRISHDPLIQEVTQDIQTLSRDILLDDEGRPSLHKLQSAIQEIKHWVVPILRRELEAVVVPRIEGTTPKYSYWVDNITLVGKDIIPEKILIDINTFSEINVTEISPDEISAQLTIEVKDVATNFKDIRFWLKRTAMPTYEDSGVVNVDVDKVDFCLKWKVKSKGSGPWKFHIHKVDINIGHFQVVIRDAKHSTLDKALMKLFNSFIKKSIESGVENYLREKLIEWNDQLERIVNQK